MNLERLYDIAENEHIKIYDWHIEDCNGIYLNYDNINAIALNYDDFGTYIDEKCTLAEELGHYYMDATYSVSADKVLIDKQEYRAKKFSYKMLVPLEDLKSYIQKGYTKIYELAEIFEVTEEFMRNTIDYYKQKEQILIF